MATFDDVQIVSLASSTAEEEPSSSSDFYTTDEDDGRGNDSGWFQIIFVGF